MCVGRLMRFGGGSLGCRDVHILLFSSVASLPVFIFLRVSRLVHSP